MEPDGQILTMPIKSPLNLYAWTTGLADHTDTNFVNFLLDGIQEGVDIGYTGPRFLRIHDNWPSLNIHRDEVESIITDDILRGHVLGPFVAPPTSGFVGNPMGAYIKKRSNKVRLITDLSHPPSSSVNDFIKKEDFSLEYIKFDDIVATVNCHGRHAFMAKLDLESAFKQILVKPSQWELLGFTLKFLDNMGVEQLFYYMYTCLPFGLRSAPKLFDCYAQGLEYIMIKNGVTSVCHYLDDSFTVSSDIVSCKNNLDIMLKTCSELGFVTQPKKTVQPTTCIEMLGIIIDTDHMQLRISEARLNSIKEDIYMWSHKRTCTKRQLLSLIGKLEFICRVVRHGRSFLRRLIELSKKVKKLHHKLRLNRSALNDIQWWIDFMPFFHGVSFFYDNDWSSCDSLQLWTDASDHGIGCVFHNLYIYEKLDDFAIDMNIAWRELYAILVACATWGHHLIAKRVVFNCDNEAIVYCINSGVSKDVELMTLLRKLFFVCAYYNFECSACHLPSKSNVLADALSRGDMPRFFVNCKNPLSMQKCQAIDVLYDLYNFR